MKIKSPKTMKAIRVQAKGRCERCGQARTLDCHHWFWKTGMGGGSRLDIRINLVALCRQCHDDDGKTAQAATLWVDCKKIVMRRERATFADLSQVIALLWNAPKRSAREWFEAKSEEWPESARALLFKTLEEAGIGHGGTQQ